MNNDLNQLYLKNEIQTKEMIKKEIKKIKKQIQNLFSLLETKYVKNK